ncbi:hypothetical protein B0H15DRAFT_923543 [Mycena belliarum]|uniref:Cytochrome P450 n=1 Tax=Mycena belliarum TaxID=1033014 RepID=A0AAD6TZF6_9AGAR|nr:hypothetical protein B0H15DRAFT_923543 [Mycena belliae]
MSNLKLYGICLCAAILTFFFIFRFWSLHRQGTVLHQTLESIRLLLDPPDTPKDTLLRSRASANARLVGAFHLTNTFVSPDPAVNSAFRTQSSRLLQAAQRDWRQFSDIALQAVEMALPDRRLNSPFDGFVATVTLSTIIVGLLEPHADIAALAANDLEIVSNLITHIWILSKKPEPIPPQLLQKLNDHLRHLIPDQLVYPNPLDFVIPTWETLWRVVAAALVHIHRDVIASEAFRDLIENPSFVQFRASRLARTSPSVEDYILETLRLDPPVRHMARKTVRQSKLTEFLPRFLAGSIPPQEFTEVADIESAQRSAFWGDHPETFEAARFRLDSESVSSGDLLAFGCGPLKCVASQWAPMAVAVIVGAILNRVDGSGYSIVHGRGVGGRQGWEGWTVCRVDVDT